MQFRRIFSIKSLIILHVDKRCDIMTLLKFRCLYCYEYYIVINIPQSSINQGSIFLAIIDLARY